VIGYVRGRLAATRPPFVIVEAHGVGYEVESPLNAFHDLPEIGAEVTLHTHLVVREDAHLLFGFTRSRQRDLFRRLLRVSGIGPKVALAVLSGLSDEDFVLCVTTGDTSGLTRVPGIGRKTAERLVMEMRDAFRDGLEGIPGAAPLAAPGKAGDPVADAVLALVALGYRQPEALRAVRSQGTEGRTSDEIVRDALRAMGGAVP